MAVDSAGNALTADESNNRVRVVAVSPSNPGYPLSGCGGMCTWSAGDIYTIVGTGTSGYNGDGIRASAAKLSAPASVAVDSAGNALTADESNNRVRVVAVSPSNPGYPLSGCGGVCTWSAGDIYTIVGTGTSGYNGDGIAAATAEVKQPQSLAVDRTGNVLVADNNNRVRVVAVSPSNPGYRCPVGVVVVRASGLSAISTRSWGTAASAITSTTFPPRAPSSDR